VIDLSKETHGQTVMVAAETSKEKISDSPYVIVENDLEEAQGLSPLVPMSGDMDEEFDSEAAKKKAEADNGNELCSICLP